MSSFVECIETARKCSGLFRLGREVEAALVMIEALEQVQVLMAGQPGAVERWPGLLADMLDAQQSQDWLGLADSLEYEVVELLASCSGGFHRSER